jgi:cysteinyl-tRNA synthetase
MELVLRDTLSGTLRPVRRRPGRPLALYVCGPTVYDVAHVGHGRTYLFFDVARRFLEAEGMPVRHVMNVTDFEDKLDARAVQLGMSWRALARREERGFFRDLAALGLLPPHARTRATEFVPLMIRVARRLERTGRVRREGDEWIYTPPPRAAGENFPTDRQLATHAVTEPGHPFPERREVAGEFMVWRLQRPPKPSWPSPWGRGIPGWHLECYAMAERFLGIPVDLHGGGPDLIYPHHYAENEVALALRGTLFSRVFLHTGFVLVGGDKMSKSTGNLISLRAALDDVGPGALRWYLLSLPPTQRLPWDPVALHQAAEEYAFVRETVRKWLKSGDHGRGSSSEARRLSEAVRRELAHGLATDRAFGRIRAWTRSVRERSAGGVKPSERAAARRAFEAIERRTGLPLL